MAEAAEAVHPAQQALLLALSITMKLLQKFGGHRETVLERAGDADKVSKHGKKKTGLSRV